MSRLTSQIEQLFIQTNKINLLLVCCSSNNPWGQVEIYLFVCYSSKLKMPVKKDDAHRALELLEEYCARLSSPADKQLRIAIEKVIYIFKSSLFQALLGKCYVSFN